MKDVPESFERKIEKAKVRIELMKKRNKREGDRKRGRINRIIQTADGTAITSEHQQGSVNTLYSISSLGRAGYCVCMCVMSHSVCPILTDAFKYHVAQGINLGRHATFEMLSIC